MKTDLLKDIIAGKNHQMEREAVRSAEHIIETIIQRQAVITKATEDIVQLRAELKVLEIVQIDPTTVLG